jgi:putative endonuclease
MIAMRKRQPAVYLLASKPNGTLYVGVTSNLVQRVWQHRNGVVDGFTKRYSVHRLVWFEMADRMDSAIQREKQIKKWNRAWKIEMIERTNPHWRDLWPALLGEVESVLDEKLDSRPRSESGMTFLRGNDGVM